jgi:hypothetical protein
LVLDRSHGRDIPSAEIKKVKLISYTDAGHINCYLPKYIETATPDEICKLITAAVNDDTLDGTEESGPDQLVEAVKDEHIAIVMDAANLGILPQVMTTVREILQDCGIEVPDVSDPELVSLLPVENFAAVRKSLDKMNVEQELGEENAT